jgi:glutamate N-acetyltransferase/amino-acid N-acetyltransferase
MSVTAPKGFVAGGVACGIKQAGALDLAMVAADAPVPAAGVFTRNLAAAPPVIVSRRHMAGGRIRAVVISSGCANAATGEAGREAAESTAREVASRLGCLPREVVVCSTGPIGGLVPVDRIAAGLDVMELTEAGADLAARAILTTDSRPKQQVKATGGFIVGGMAKGAGMIRPDMATMLAVITTDAIADPLELDGALRRAVDRSFNALDIDGCESTNDTVVILASGKSGARPDSSVLAGAVEDVCRGLAAQMAADAEGASKVVTLELRGAPDDDSALKLARAVADSALVRASFFGADPNWGRVVAALGSARVHFDPELVEVDYAGTAVAREGVDLGADHDAISAKLKGDFTVSVSVGTGPGRCSLLTTDLTPEYVRFNGERS